MIRRNAVRRQPKDKEKTSRDRNHNMGRESRESYINRRNLSSQTEDGWVREKLWPGREEGSQVSLATGKSRQLDTRD